MDWYQITLTNDQIEHIIHVFFQTYGLLNSPKGVALLCNSEVDVIKQPPVPCYYFTPTSIRLFSDLIHEYGGKACPEPSPEKTKYVGGDDAFHPAQRVNEMGKERLNAT